MGDPVWRIKMQKKMIWPNKTESKQSEPNWKIYNTFKFSIFYFHLLTFNFELSTFDLWFPTFHFWILTLTFDLVGLFKLQIIRKGSLNLHTKNLVCWLWQKLHH